MKSILLRWYIPVFICIILFINHYTRDTVGALERQIEEDLHISISEYSMLNSLFFVPNTIIPMFATLLCIWLGGTTQVVLFGVSVTSCGHVLFAIGASMQSNHVMDFGRLISGSTYELIDCVPIAIVGPLFRSEWGMLVGIVNGILRSGSVFSFVINPILYKAYGVNVALWCSALMSVLGIFAAYGLVVALQRYESQVLKEQLSNTVDTDTHAHTHTHPKSKSIEMVEYNPIHTGTDMDDMELELELDNDDSDELGGLGLGSGLGVCVNDEYIHNQQGSRVRSGSTSSSAALPLSRSREDSSETASGIDSNNNSNNNKNSNNSNNNSKDEPYSSYSASSTPYRIHLHLDQVLISMGCPYEYSEYIQITCENMLNTILEHFPFHEYGITIYIYILGAVCLYGAMVPFWFIGSKLLQLNYNMSMSTADSYMLLPEGAMVVISPLFGLYLDRTAHALSTKINFLAIACIGLGMAYLCLSVGYSYNNDKDNTIIIPPLISMTLLGVSYGLSNSTMWSCLIFVVVKDSHLLSISSLMSCALNLLPAVMPIFIVLIDGVDYTNYTDGGGESSYGLILMLIVSILAGGCFYGASRSCSESKPHIDEEKKALVSEVV